MTNFTIHNAQSAPQGSGEFIDNAQKQFGMVPNLIGMLAESPVAVEAYETLAGLFTKTSFSATERNIVWLAISSENECEYCMAAHTAIAMGEKIDGQIIEAIRSNETLEDARLETLRSFTASVVANRGHVNEDEVAGFLDAGFTKENILEIIVGISHKILSNYVNHISETPLDKPFEKFAWTPSAVNAS